MKNKKRYFYIGLPILGMIFYLVYIRRSAIDMVYSDYIRLINSYLPDVWNPDKFFVADLLTRIPVNFLERGLNVMIFGYSVTVDRAPCPALGVSAPRTGSACPAAADAPPRYTHQCAPTGRRGPPANCGI